MRTALRIIALSMSGFAACDVTGPERAMDLGNRSGTAVSSPDEQLEWYANPPVWTPDGRSLAYIGDSAIVLWDRATETRRVVFRATDYRLRPGALATSPDGHTIYYVAAREVGGGLGLWRVALQRGDPEFLADSVGEFLVSPDNEHVVYQLSPDERQEWPLWLCDTVAGSCRTLGLTQASALAFAPDGGRLLYLRLAGAAPERSLELRTLTLESGASELLDDAVDMAGLKESRWWWGGDGIHRFVRTQSDALVVRHLDEGSTSKLYEPSFDGMIDESNVTPDLAQVAFWVRKCVKYEPYLDGERCTAERAALYVVEVASQQDVWIAGGSAGSAAAFSPGGRHIAYYLDGRLYVSAVP